MNRHFIALSLILILLNSCQGQDAKDSPAGKGTTINPDTSSSGLFLDSLMLEGFIKEQKAGDTEAKQLRNFYKIRMYRFAWFTETGITENLRAYWTLHNNYINNFGDTALRFAGLHHDIDGLLTTDNVPRIPHQKKLRTELQLTSHFFVYLNNAYAGKADPAVMQWHIPRKKLDGAGLLHSFLARNGKDIEDWEPVNIYYKRLKKELLHYEEIEKNGGWKRIAIDGLRAYSPGDSSAVIRQVKQRLLSAFSGIKIDTSLLYGNDLLALVKSAQRSFGLKEDGVIGAALIKELNVPVKDRKEQMLINLERMRWLPQQPQGEFIAVNIPEFRLHVFSGEKKVFSIDIVVGQTAHNTVIFADKLQYIVFSPYWNVPPSIVQKEILPAIRKSRNYLSKNNMEQTGSSGGLPVIRQKPGGANALGKVKFIFPNSYNIYFHDTPAKSLFGEEARALSHGCIRLAEPAKLATYLLRNQREWTTRKINDALSASVEKWVTLKEEVPVYITYFTAWADSDGLLNFRKDIYNHDKKVSKSLHE